MDNDQNKDNTDRNKRDQGKNTTSDKKGKNRKRDISSTTSLGKRRKLVDKKGGAKTSRALSLTKGLSDNSQEESPQQGHSHSHQNQEQHQHLHHQQHQQTHHQSTRQAVSTMSEPRTSEYGSQATLLRVPLRHKDEKPTKVAIIGAAGGIGQPLSLLLMLHSEYIQHLALYDLAHVRGVGADLSHIDRHCMVTTHLGPDELIDAIKDTSVIVILAGIAQKPGMSRDDLFGTNAKIMFDLAKACATHAPEAHLAIVSNPVNSLVPIVNLVYQRILGNSPGTNTSKADDLSKAKVGSDAAFSKDHGTSSQGSDELPAWSRRIFGVTTLDVVRASTLSARSAFYTPGLHNDQPASGNLGKDPSKVSMPVVGGHAGKTILPLLSRASPSIDKKKLTDDMKLTCKVIESVQEAGIEVLNAKKGAGSATLSMAYSACRFTVSLLRAQLGETNIVECGYVRHPKPVFDNLEYFALPLILGKHGYVKSISPLSKILPFEQQMAEEAARLLRASVARGEDFAKEQLSIDKN